MIKAIIFDMDGVLIDSEPYYLQRRIDFFESINITVSKQKLQTLVGGNMRTVLSQIVPNKSTAEYQQILDWYHQFKFDNPLAVDATLQPGAAEILKELQQRKIKLALASSSDRAFIDHILSETGLTEIFTAVLSGQDFVKSKPDPSIYLATLAALNLPAIEVLAIEDSAMGIASAKRAGIYTLAYQVKNPLVATDQSEADQKLTSFFEITKYL